MQLKPNKIPTWAAFFFLMALLLWIFYNISQPGLSQTGATPAKRVGQHATVSALVSRHSCHMLLTVKDTHNPNRYFLPGAHPVSQAVPAFVIQPRQGVCNESLDLVVLVPSLAEKADRRQTIRRTWGSVSFGQPWPHAKTRNKVVVLFLLGMSASKIELNAVKKEAKKYGDLIVGDFHDTYRNLTRKILAGLTWVSTHCSGASYVTKVDDDVFLNVELTLRQVNRWFSTSTSCNTVLGRVMCSGFSVVFRHQTSRLFVADSQYPFTYYPPYVSGGHYILPQELLSPLLNASRYMPVLPVEDAYITGVLGRVLNVTHVGLPRILVFNNPPPEKSVASCFLSVHDTSSDGMMSIWNLLQQHSQYNCSQILLKDQLKTCGQTCTPPTLIAVY